MPVSKPTNCSARPTSSTRPRGRMTLPFSARSAMRSPQWCTHTRKPLCRRRTTPPCAPCGRHHAGASSEQQLRWRTRRRESSRRRCQDAMMMMKSRHHSCASCTTRLTMSRPRSARTRSGLRASWISAEPGRSDDVHGSRSPRHERRDIRHREG